MAKIKVGEKDTKIEALDTTAASIKQEYLETSAANRKVNYYAGEAMRLAVARFVADAMGLKGDDRVALFKLIEATPGWFACGNGSACRQHFEKTKSAVAEIAKDYAGM